MGKMETNTKINAIFKFVGWEDSLLCLFIVEMTGIARACF